jgi:sulfate adenylyltransferase
VLAPAQVRALELLASGALRPLTGFMDAETADAVRRTGALPDGTPWPAPLELVLPDAPPVGEPAALRDREGDLLAALHVRQTRPAEGGTAVAGDLEVIAAPVHHDLLDRRLTPEAFARAHGRVPVVVTDRPLEAAQVAAADGPLHALALEGGAGPGHVRAPVLVRALEAAGAASVTVVPAPPGDPAAWAPILAGAYGTGTAPLPPPATADADLRTALATGLVPSALGAAVAEVLQAEFPPPERVGFTVLLTGLSGSGKSTVAGALAARLGAAGPRRVTLLDGDLVRAHLSSELGFSREHRDLNVLRIGFVAAEVTRHGGIAIAAPIAPYAATRQGVRELVEAVGRFVLVHVATPLEVCEARDRKGLYARARAGLIPAFTGISDPYEAPEDADVVIDTSRGTPGEAAAVVEAHLRDVGLLAVGGDGAGLDGAPSGG